MGVMGVVGKKGLVVGLVWFGEKVLSFLGWELKILEDYVRLCLIGKFMIFEEVRVLSDLLKV